MVWDLLGYIKLVSKNRYAGVIAATFSEFCEMTKIA